MFGVAPSNGVEIGAYTRRMSTLARRERKVITVVFADLVGFTARSESLDPEDVEAFLAPYHALLRTELERFGGTVEKFIGDAVVAVFGAPVTHEDDPERAVRAALAIRDAIREEGKLEVRIAVNTGEAIVHLDARPDRGEAIAAGDVLNTASRLQAAAPVNGVIVGEATYGATRDVIRYEDAERVTAKGKAEPIPTWEAIEARSRLGVDARQGSTIPLIGRTRERSMLVDALKRAESERSPQLVTVVGVPGIGKSRLVFELLGHLESDAELRYWRQGRCLPYGDGVSFWALGEMVKAQAGILDGDPGDLVAEKLARAVREVVPEGEAAWVTGWLRPLVGLEAESSLMGERRHESFTAWRRFFEGLAENRTLVLAFEDLHWADDGLLDFIDHIVDWGAEVPLLVVCTTRPELLERRPAWSGGKLNAMTLALSPLTADEAERLLASVLDGAQLSGETKHALLERASGNPLYAEQFARLYLERGSAEDISLPESVQGLIAARLDALPAAEKALLQDASVMGKVFWPGSLGAQGNVAERLHALGRKEFVRRERRTSVVGEDEFAFRHILVRDVAYSQIPRTERAGKHLRAAQWIESLGSVQDHAELLAHHYEAVLALTPGDVDTGLARRARQAFVDAGNRAVAFNAFGPAVAFYRSAVSLLPGDDPNRGQLLFRLGRAEFFADGSGAEHLSEASAALAANGGLGTAAEAESVLASLSWSDGDRARSDVHMERAMELVAGLPPSRDRAAVIAKRARNLVIAGDPAASLELAREALATAEALGLDEIRAHALNTIGLAGHDSGDPGWYEAIRESIAISTKLNTVEIFNGLHNLSVLLETDGHLEDAYEAHLLAVAEGERFGAYDHIRWSRHTKVWWAYRRGEWDEAARMADELIAESERGERTYLDGGTRSRRAMIRVARDDVPGALEDARIGLAAGRAAVDPQAIISILVAHLVALAEAGERPAAARALEELAALGGTSDLYLSYGGGAQVAWAAAWLGEGQVFDHQGGVPPNVWGEAARAIAKDDWRTAVAAYEGINSLPDIAFARLMAAKSLVANGDRSEAASVLAPAMAFYRSVGATRFLSRGEGLLDEID